MKIFVWLAVVATSLAGCVTEHVRMEIPPPGGCDQCHRIRIASGWEVALSPVALGKTGGAPVARDVQLRELQTIPVHSRVPAQRLEVYAASAPPSTVGDSETGIQCFVCHVSPGPPHETLRGTFRHPWEHSSGDR